MYILLTLFFISLVGIIVMIGRKLLMFQNGQILDRGEIIFKIPHFEELKYLITKNIKKHGYKGLVVTIRFYFRSANLLKNKYQEVKIKVKDMRVKNSKNNGEQQKEVSKFLKIISEYKHKIREIKHKIKEEENL